MDCPVCKNVSLVMSERQGIEIDYCPNCRGVWLDRGELDKIIDRSAAPQAAAASAPIPQSAVPPRAPDPRDLPDPRFAQPDPRHMDPRYAQPDPRYPQHGQPQYPGHGHYPHHKKKKREGFLSDLFDFD